MKKVKTKTMTMDERTERLRSKLALVHWRKSTEARAAELDMCGMPTAAKALRKLIRGK